MCRRGRGGGRGSTLQSAVLHSAVGLPCSDKINVMEWLDIFFKLR